MPLQGRVDLLAARALEATELILQGVQMEEVAVPSSRRTGAAVADFPEIVGALILRRLHPFRQCMSGRRQIEGDTMREEPAGGVGIVPGQGVRLGPGRSAGPGQRRRDVLAVAGGGLRDLLAVL